MKAKLKSLGAALVAVLAMSALLASAAHAQTTFTLTGDAGTTKLDGVNSGAHVFTQSAGRSYTCTSVTSTGAVILPTSTVTVSPVFTGCTSSIGVGTPLPVTITMNGCDFLFHLTGTDADGDPDGYVGDTDVLCPESKKIDIHVYKEGTQPSEHSDPTKILCTYTIGPQTVNSGIGGSSAITYDITTGAKSSEDDIDITTNATGIVMTKDTGTITNCGSANQTATYTGTSTVTGTSSLGVKTGIRLSD
jgi:hypothetical protein